jgi:hypothetical protein
MSENRVHEQIRSRDDESSSDRVPPTLTVVDSTVRRFTVNALRRVPHAHIPTIVIGAIVVIVATVMFVADILVK